MAQRMIKATLAAFATTESFAQYCAKDGGDYSYTEAVSGDTRTITYNGCPNHPWYQLNPNKPYDESMTVTVPAKPQFKGAATDSDTASANVDLSEQGGSAGVLFNGAMLFSPFGGPSYGAATGYDSSATYAEGVTFDQCGCHASSTDSASYHCHVPPTCLLNQLGQADAAHSPQVGWANDGFPVYGPLGPSGTAMKTCTVTGGTYGTDVCTDDCGGYYSEDGSIDDYKYRYYIQGTYNDGTSCDNPGCPSPGEDYFPNTPMCYRGCCPDGVSCSDEIAACSGTYADGFTSNFTAAVPTINSLSLASGLPANPGACDCDDLTTATCDATYKAADNEWTQQEESCPSSSGDSTDSSGDTSTATVATTSFASQQHHVLVGSIAAMAILFVQVFLP